MTVPDENDSSREATGDQDTTQSGTVPVDEPKSTPTADGRQPDDHSLQEQPPERAEWKREQQPERDTENEWILFGRDITVSVLAVALIGAYLFAISGVWPPMVAIESGSMEPNMNVNDLVFVMDTDRFQPEIADNSGIVSAERGSETDYSQFGDHGDVIIYAPNGNTEVTPVIHRAMLWVEEGENWVERADEDALGGVESCDDIERVCPAPNDGFITKGDDNQVYDQVQGDRPVNPDWIVGTAEVRVPGLGWLRLQF